MTALLLAVALVVAEKPALRVYVHTKIDASGFVDADQQRRVDSVRDLLGRIDKDTKRFQPVIVESAAQADLIVEVVSSSNEDLGNRTAVNAGFGVAVSRVSKRRIVRANVRVGDYSTEIASPPKANTWGVAAKLWQVEFRKWVDANSDRLLAGRAR